MGIKLVCMKHPAYNQLRPVTQSAAVVLCANPSYSSLDGTNTWVIRAPEDSRSIVIDPGPDDEGHLNIVHNKAEEVALVLITHRHQDHADSIDRFRQLTGAPVRGFDPTYCRGAEPLVDGEIITLEGVTPQIEVVHTPGHTSDSACFFVWSGVPHDSTLEGVMLLPAHGPEHEDLSLLARKYLDRREQRLAQVQAAREKLGHDATLKQIVDEVCTDVDPVLRGAAEQSTRVTVRYLDKVAGV